MSLNVTKFVIEFIPYNTLQRHYEVRHKSIAGYSYIRACNRHPSTGPDCYQQSAEERVRERERGEGREGRGTDEGGGEDKGEMSLGSEQQIIMTINHYCMLLKCFHVTD